MDARVICGARRATSLNLPARQHAHALAELGTLRQCGSATLAPRLVIGIMGRALVCHALALLNGWVRQLTFVRWDVPCEPAVGHPICGIATVFIRSRHGPLANAHSDGQAPQGRCLIPARTPALALSGWMSGMGRISGYIAPAA